MKDKKKYKWLLIANLTGFLIWFLPTLYYTLHDRIFGLGFSFYGLWMAYDLDRACQQERKIEEEKGKEQQGD